MRLSLVFGAVLFLSACVAIAQTDRQRVATIDTALTVLVEETTTQRELGVVSDVVWKCFKKVANILDKQLDLAHEDAITSKPVSNILGTVKKTTTNLQLMLNGGAYVC